MKQTEIIKTLATITALHDLPYQERKDLIDEAVTGVLGLTTQELRDIQYALCSFGDGFSQPIRKELARRKEEAERDKATSVNVSCND
jgi:ATP-dependent DNA ligase